MSTTLLTPFHAGMRGPGSPAAANGHARARRRPSARATALGEALFREALVRERRRADRSGQPFVVLLVNGRGMLDDSAWSSVVAALAAAKRSIDVVGWLERGSVLGVLLPEVGTTQASRVKQRVLRELARRLGDAETANLSVWMHGHGVATAPGHDPVWPADPLVEAFGTRRSRAWHDAAKRGLDVVGSLLLLVCLSPLFAMIAAAVRLTSPGPALFRQVRVGRRGEPFTMLKFRTMHQDADAGLHHDYVSWFITQSSRQPRTGGEVFKLANDPRVTGIGHFLRKTSLDELPQFWNVLRGDMSLVGPRPPLPFEVDRYQPWHRRRMLEVKPGITGLWQVNGRSRTTFDDMVRMDLHYARTRSFWTDIRILAATPRAVISGKGAM